MPWHKNPFEESDDKSAFKKHIQSMLLSILEAEDDYVEALILLQKIAKYV